MAFSSTCVAVGELSRTYPRFEFQGVREHGYCHLKIEIRNAMPVFLCSALLYYGLEPLTWSSNDIRRRVITMLYDEGIVTSTRRPGIVARLSPRSFEERQRQDIIDFFDRSSLWVHYFPAMLNMFDEDIYDLINFRGRGPTLMSQEEIAETTGLNTSFFTVSSDDLDFRRD